MSTHSLNEEITLTTADTVPYQERRVVEVIKVIHVIYRAHDVHKHNYGDTFEGAKYFLRKEAYELQGTEVVGIRFEFGDHYVRATGTVIRIQE